MTEGRNGGEYDVRLRGDETFVIETHRRQRRRRQVRDHDIGGGDETPDDATSRFGHRVQREAALVAVHLKEHRTFAAFARARIGDDRLHEAILAALALLDADDFRAEVAEQRRAIGTGDIAAEIEHADARKNAASAGFACHRPPLPD